MVASISALFPNSNKPTVRSSERTALAAAIAEAAEAQRKADASRAAIPRAEAMVAQAQGRLDQATDSVAASRDAQAARMAAAAASGAALAPDPGMRQSRLLEADAEDELDAARAALASVEAATVEAEKRVEGAKINVSNCAKRVVKSMKSTAIAKVRALRAELDSRTLELTKALNTQVAYLHFTGDKQCEEIPGSWPMTDEDQQMYSIINQEQKLFDHNVREPVRGSWTKALADLHSDPDAALPV